MKEVLLVFFNLGYKNNYQAKVYIYDKKQNLIESGLTYNSKYKTCLKKNNIYFVKALFYNEILYTCFYVNNNYQYCFYFNHSIINNNKFITIKLTDLYYKDLPIERGILNLWQKQ